MKECKEKFEEEKNLFNEEEKKTNYNIQLDKVKKEENCLIDQYNQQHTTYQENKNNEVNAKIQEAK